MRAPKGKSDVVLRALRGAGEDGLETGELGRLGVSNVRSAVATLQRHGYEIEVDRQLIPKRGLVFRYRLIEDRMPPLFNERPS